MSGGILGMFSPQGQGSGLLGNFNQGVTDNTDSLVGLGLGLMSGNMNTAAEGYAAGNRTDTLRRQQKLLQDQEMQKRTAAQGLIQKYNIPPELATDPDAVFGIAKSLEIQRRTPKEPSEFERLTQGMDPAMVERAKLAKLGLGPEKQAVPSGYRYKPDGTLEPIPGGPAMSAEMQTKALPAELGAKIGLANEYFRRYDGIEKDLTSDDPSVVGAWDNTRAQAGFGKGGAIYRDIKLGSEAMTRMLTGAGMSQSEAENEVAQYLPALRDDARTVLDKQKRLRSALRSMQREALRGRMPQENLDRDYPEFPAEPHPDSAAASIQKGVVPSGSYNYDPSKGLVPAR